MNARDADVSDDRLAQVKDLPSERARRDARADREQEPEEDRPQAASRAQVKGLTELEREAKALALAVEVRTAEIEEYRTALSAERGMVESQRERSEGQGAKLKAAREEIRELREARRAQRGELEAQRRRRAAQFEALKTERAQTRTQREEVARLRAAADEVPAQLAAVREHTARTFVDALPRRRLRAAWRLMLWLTSFRIGNLRTYLAIRRSGRFDAGFYFTEYPEVAVRRENPIIHYIATGAAQRRNPSPEFSTAAYLADHPELAETGENPLRHWIRSEDAAHSERR